jgi:uncharacterized protein (DUF58 family)
VTRRPTRRSFGLAGLGALLVGVGATAQAGWLFVLAAGVMGALAASVALSPRLDRWRIRRDLPATATVGDEVPVRLEMVAESRRARAPVLIEDHHPALSPAVILCEPAAVGYAVAAEHRTSALRRGVFPAGELRLTSDWPFGVLAARRTLDVASPIVVVPRPIPLHAFPLVASGGAGQDASVPPSGGHGDAFAGVRDYRAGDDVRRVHWRSTARRGHFVVREEARAALPHVAIVLAGADRGAAPDSAFDALVTAAASIAVHALSYGHGVDLVRAEPGEQPLRLRAADSSRVLTWLAAAQPVDAPLLPLVRDAAGAAGGGTVVLCLSTEGRAASELGAARTTIARTGAACVVVAALASTWADVPGAVATPAEDAMVVSGADRVLRRNESLRSCLEG